MAFRCLFVLAAAGALHACNETVAVEADAGAPERAPAEPDPAKDNVALEPPDASLPEPAATDPPAVRPEEDPSALPFEALPEVLGAGFCDTVGFDGTFKVAPTGERFVDVTSGVRVDAKGAPVSWQHFTSSVALADFDDNGLPDLATLGHGKALYDGVPLGKKVVGPGTMKLFANCGGRFVEALDFHEEFPDAIPERGSAIAAVDVDGDARPDVVLGTFDGRLLLFRFVGYSGGEFVFAPPVEIAGLGDVEVARISTLTFWDFDANGRLDVYAGRMNPIEGGVNTFSVTVPDLLLLQDESGAFEDAMETPGWEALRKASSHQTFAAAVVPFPPGDGRYFLYAGMDGGFDAFALMTPAESGPPVPAVLDVKQSSWMMPWAAANTMGADLECSDDLHCRLLATDFGAPHSFHVTRGPEPSVVLATDEDFGETLEVAHSLWSATFVDIDRDGRREIVAAAGETAVKGPKGPNALVEEETLVLYAWDDELGRFDDVSEDMGACFTQAKPGNWAMAFVADLDGDRDLDVVATPIPRLPFFAPDPGALTAEEYEEFVAMVPDFDPRSPLTFLHYTEGPRDGRAIFVRLRGPGHRVLGSRIEVACHDASACAGFEGLLQEMTATGNFIGTTREVGVFEFPVGEYEGLSDVKVTSRDGTTLKVKDVPAGSLLVLDVP